LKIQELVSKDVLNRFRKVSFEVFGFNPLNVPKDMFLQVALPYQKYKQKGSGRMAPESSPRIETRRRMFVEGEATKSQYRLRGRGES